MSFQPYLFSSYTILSRTFIYCALFTPYGIYSSIYSLFMYILLLYIHIFCSVFLNLSLLCLHGAPVRKQFLLGDKLSILIVILIIYHHDLAQKNFYCMLRHPYIQFFRSLQIWYIWKLCLIPLHVHNSCNVLSEVACSFFVNICS